MRLFPALLLFLHLCAAGAEPKPLEGTGVVIPWREIDLAARSDGVIQEVLVNEGDPIQPGQLLGKLEARREELEVESGRVLFEKRHTDLKRFETLYQQKAGVSEKDLEDKRIESQLAETSYKLAMHRLEEKQLKSPISGLLVRRLKEPGEAIQKLEVFATLVSLEKLYVSVFFEGDQLQKVQRGQKAEVRLHHYPGETLPGKVEIVDPIVDPSSGLFRVKILVENPSQKFRSGSKADVRLFTN